MSGSAFAVTHHAFSSGAGRTSDGNGSHASTLKSPSYTKSVSWQHYHELHDRYTNHSNIIIIHNPDYAQGLLTSVKAAASVVQTEFCFLTHGDMPTINSDIFRKIWALRNNGAILPLHKGIPGHPILVSKSCLMQAVQRPNISNMRQSLLMGEHYSVEIENEEIILDIDTPDDFINAQKRYTKI